MEQKDKVKVYISLFAAEKVRDDRAPTYWVTDYPPGAEWVLIEEVEIEVTRPTAAESIPKQVAALREQQEKLKAETLVKCQRVEVQIQNLLALEGPKDVRPPYGDPTDPTDNDIPF